MWVFLKSVIESPEGSFAFVFGGVVLIGWFVFWVYGKFVLLTAEHNHIKSSYEDLTKKVDSGYDRLDKRIDTLRDEVHSMKGDIQYIKNMLNVQVNTPVSGQPSMMQSHSPLALTDVGKKAVADMNAETALAANWDRIKALLDHEVVSHNPYDIQTYCLERIPVSPELFFSSKDLDAFKLFAFNNGRTLFECLKVIGILVRDRYFAALGLNLESLDKPSPSPS